MNSNGDGISEDVSYTLNATDVDAIAFTQNQRDEVRMMDVAGALASEPGMKQQTYVTAPTLVSEGDAHSGFRDEHGLICAEISQTLTSGGTGERGHMDPTNTELVAAFSAGQSEGAGTIAYQEEQSPTLRGASSGTNQVPAMMRGMQVRRLTPRECERLQGFPDDHTLIPVSKRNKKAELEDLNRYHIAVGNTPDEKWSKDGPRYKALGNSMAVPVMRWIGSRILTSISESADRPDFRDTTK